MNSIELQKYLASEGIVSKASDTLENTILISNKSLDKIAEALEALKLLKKLKANRSLNKVIQKSFLMEQDALNMPSYRNDISEIRFYLYEMNDILSEVKNDGD